MTNNKLKIIAIISMIIDHFGYYFADTLNGEVYIVLRCIGRIAMPIFTFLIVEGYFHTSDYKRYLTNLFGVAVITQISFFVLDFIAKESSYNLFYTANILFSFSILLSLIKLFENIENTKLFKDKLIFLIFIMAVIVMYQFVKFDYGIKLLILGFSMYIGKKYITKEDIYKMYIAICIAVISIINSMEINIQIFAVLAIIPILLYNGKLGKKSVWLKRLFYIIFPLQHIIMYLIHILN